MIELVESWVQWFAPLAGLFWVLHAGAGALEKVGT